MPVAERDNALSALQVANEIREVRSHQRHALRGASPRTMLPVLIDPPAELASYCLGDLFTSKNFGLIPQLGPVCLGRIFQSLHRRTGQVHTWSEETRLRDLSKTERRMLAEELKRRGPRSWRNA